MSIRVMSLVWDRFPGSGSDLLTLLALADWSDDQGRCFPSIASIARKTRLSESQARRVVHGLIDMEVVKVTANAKGGRSSRVYQIDLGRLSTPSADDTPTPSTGGTPSPSTGARHP